MEINQKTKIIAVSVALLASFAAGRYATPDKVVTITKTVETDKKSDVTKTDINKKTRKKIVIVETKKPDGTDQKTTTITDATDTNNKSDSVKSDISKKDDETSKTVTKGDKVTISMLAGAQFNVTNGSPLLYGGSITKPVLGPITLGIWGLSNASGGFSLGLTF